MTHRVLVIDDHHLVRAGVRSLLEGAGFDVCGELDRVDGSADHIAQIRPDVVLVDLRLPDGSGIALVRALRRANPPLNVLAFSGYDHPIDEARSHQEGANGFFAKSMSGTQLVDAVRRVAQGEMLWTHNDLRRLSSYIKQLAQSPNAEVALTPRERQILAEIVDGASNKEIAGKFAISAETVKEHIQHLFRKLGVSDRTQAAVLAIRRGYCDNGEAGPH